MSGNSRTINNVLKAAVIIAAAAFILIGLHRGEAEEIMRKAVKICLECIGIA